MRTAGKPQIEELADELSLWNRYREVHRAKGIDIAQLYAELAAEQEQKLTSPGGREDFGELCGDGCLPLALAALITLLRYSQRLEGFWAELVGRPDNRDKVARTLEIMDWDFVDASKGFQRAITLDHNYATAHQWYAEYLANMGQFEEAIAEILRAKELDPLSPIVHWVAGHIYQGVRRYDDAIREYEKALICFSPRCSQKPQLCTLGSSDRPNQSDGGSLPYTPAEPGLQTRCSAAESLKFGTLAERLDTETMSNWAISRVDSMGRRNTSSKTKCSSFKG